MAERERQNLCENEYNLSNHQMNLFKLPLLTLTMAAATREECKKNKWQNFPLNAGRH
jgi:hypothetical protein